MPARNATLIGLSAVILWSTIVGFMRSITTTWGPEGGAAMIYSLSAIILYLSAGLPKLSRFPRRYLISGSLLFVSYEICLALSVGFAQSDTQAIEVGMVNYLWPSLTLLLSTLVNGKKIGLLMVAGMFICLLGIGQVLGGQEGLSLAGMMGNIASNPVSFILAFSGAIIWSIYCVTTSRLAKGNNGITFFFILTAVVLWIKYLFSDAPALVMHTGVVTDLFIAAGAMGFGYAAWNIGMLRGNVTLLATASYFTPVLSAVFAGLLLKQSLSMHFWAGAGMVCLGSLICWQADRRERRVLH